MTLPIIKCNNQKHLFEMIYGVIINSRTVQEVFCWFPDNTNKVLSRHISPEYGDFMVASSEIKGGHELPTEVYGFF